MKYLVLIYGAESAWAAMSPQEAQQVSGRFMSYSEDIRRSGHYLGGNALQPVSAATTVRVREGKVSATDGPFAETKEQLGGYYLIEAKDLNEAIQVAARVPSAHFGSIEVRPIRDMGPPPATATA